MVGLQWCKKEPYGFWYVSWWEIQSYHSFALWDRCSRRVVCLSMSLAVYALTSLRCCCSKVQALRAHCYVTTRTQASRNVPIQANNTFSVLQCKWSSVWGENRKLKEKKCKGFMIGHSTSTCFNILYPGFMFDSFHHLKRLLRRLRLCDLKHLWSWLFRRSWSRCPRFHCWP